MTQTNDPVGEGQSNRKDWLDKVAVILSACAFLAAAVAAGFTGYQAWTASDTEKRQLRAYLSAAPLLNVVPMFGEGQTPAVRVEVWNAGQTPARNVITLAKAGMKPYPLPPNPDFSMEPPKEQPSVITLAPGNKNPLGIEPTLGPPLTKDQATALQTGSSQRYYLWGTTTYSDVFGVPHWTDFCFYYYGMPASVGFCSTHNVIDDRPD